MPKRIEAATPTTVEKAHLQNVPKRSIILFGFIAVISIIFHFSFRSSPLTLFILCFLGERVYESYFKVKRYADGHLTQDRHLKRIITAFSIMVFGAICEFYLKRRSIIPSWTALGCLVLLISGYLRYLAIQTIGNDWAIDTYAVPSTIQREGPYRYVRHPYYLGVFLEAIAFPVILNSWYTLLFSIAVVAPLEGYRAILEEQVLVGKYGWGYVKFKSEVNRFLPTLIKRRVYERREQSNNNSHLRRTEQDRRAREERPPLGVDRRRIIKGWKK